MTLSRTDSQKKKKHGKRRKILIIVLTVLLVLAGSGAAYGYHLIKKLQNVTDNAQNQLARGAKSNLRAEKVDPVKDDFSILFIGIDKRKNEPSRSDALVLATFNHDTSKVHMVSIPRDSKVQIMTPDGPSSYGVSKITHAHAYGDANNNEGADYTIATVENLFKVPVDYYVQVDFNAFIKIINALGGVEMDVPVKLVTQNSKDKKGKDAIVLEPGKQQLNGEQALALVRNRKSPGAGGDFGRGKRQMQMIEAIVKKSAQLSSATKYSKIIDSLDHNFETNLTFGQMLNLRHYAGSLSSIKMEQLKGTDDSSTGTYYFALDENYLTTLRNELREQLNYQTTATSDPTESSMNTDITNHHAAGTGSSNAGLATDSSESPNN
ncbi:LCP family protein [Sporolactobacillus terrae]|uniref:LytR family transcriptional regulator n=1 Tax=Sporolactobacillus terrae TaxID=269673 RepID=A0ABX5Q5K1_9BACL|nr:LCP family protein [Sporolactobacillus terrae]QAA21931.1 LytR family transcriptional regulator [Sporolactobacillus terrae]QAA24904.1 LytR family transcriptional regulator [Sporolactobacillus terrae]